MEVIVHRDWVEDINLWPYHPLGMRRGKERKKIDLSDKVFNRLIEDELDYPEAFKNKVTLILNNIS